MNASFLSVTRIGFITAALILGATPTLADPGATFVEIGGGGGAVHAGSFEFINPQGVAYIRGFDGSPVGVSRTAGNDIILDQQRRDALSANAEVTLGRFVAPGFYIRATYRYLGAYHLSGSASFPLDSSTAIAFDQDYYLNGHGGYFGIGYQKELGGRAFVDASAEAGAAFMGSRSNQGANLGDPLGHPHAEVTRFSGGGELGLGVHLTPALDFIVKGHMDWLGTAETGVVAQDTSSADGNYGINAHEQLKLHDLYSYGAGAVLRVKF